ncbi:helix-turn-helix domain-containing protein [Stackebrandtia nassauensis]|uniref:Transcriptional regulator, ArsR family n=1 Tax=Stackebrandtia nassauensis (strain DSM 44728 / CIP 108903 / NRRL B-16338 / NBRC 102104 / LLR-40K-21) TaxID=446470 RepID=D3PWH9_STANL|nr:helix-turn-helix domain-containing protein [Stackebrandtia nassauensis]ADD43201.1 transcriptional regulator, ArsR family [Stackebrandtia nassauensis DSM 44728]
MFVESDDTERRARVHAALGEPSRLRIVDALAVADASPHELERLVGMPSNLLAHHLKTLVDAGVVTRSRSEADRRRTYLRLVPEAVASLAVLPRVVASRVVFVCTRNTARSQLAKVLWPQYSPVPAASAGTNPAARVHPRAVAVARRHGLRLPLGETHHVSDVVDDGDLVIAVCDNVHESLSVDIPRWHWSIPDPVAVDTDEAFELAFADIDRRIDRVAPLLTCRTGMS